LSIASLLYIPAVLLARGLPAEPSFVRWLGMTPAFLAGLAMLHFAVQAVRYADELQRLRAFEAIAIAFVSLALLTFSFAVLPVPLPERIRWIDVWVLLSGLWVVGTAVSYLRHR